MKTYTIIGGVNGVGKSSFTGVLKERTDTLGKIIDVDKITAQLGGNALIGGKQALSQIEQCIASGCSFTQETTLSGRRTEATVKRVKALGYRVQLYYIALDSAAESILRIENRVRRGGHNIGTEDVCHRFDHRWEALLKILPYCDGAEFYDNNNGFWKVAEYKEGQFLTVEQNLPQWLLELKSYLV